MTHKNEDERAEQILVRLTEIEEKIDEIQRNICVMIQIHEMLHPDELERARRMVEEGREAHNDSIEDPSDD